MRSIASISSLIVSALLSPVQATAGELGEHPAVIAARVYAAEGDDHASKFYPHPAWLYLSPKAPREDAATVPGVVRRPKSVAPAVLPVTEQPTPVRSPVRERTRGISR